MNCRHDAILHVRVPATASCPPIPDWLIFQRLAAGQNGERVCAETIRHETQLRANGAASDRQSRAPSVRHGNQNTLLCLVFALLPEYVAKTVGQDTGLSSRSLFHQG